MDESARQLQTLLELDARHEDLLERLDALDKQVAQVLSKYTLDRSTQAAGPDSAIELSGTAGSLSGGLA